LFAELAWNQKKYKAAIDVLEQECVFKSVILDQRLKMLVSDR